MSSTNFRLEKGNQLLLGLELTIHEYLYQLSYSKE